MTHLRIDETAHEAKLTTKHYVPFDRKFVLHPQAFVLGCTLEWLRLPANIAGLVVGKSSLGRRGLVIATATGVHPGFAGCLTLEIRNLGEIPLEVRPGMHIGQLMLFQVIAGSAAVTKSQFRGQRQPTLGKVVVDDVAGLLASVRL